MSEPGSIRYSVGGGVLTVSNDLLVFVAPSGPVADEWSELALAPATEAQLSETLSGELPSDHYLAVVQLHDGGMALLCEPGTERVLVRVERSIEASIKFGMVPPPNSSLWVGSGVVGASGLEVVGFGLVAHQEELAPDPSVNDAIPPPPLLTAPAESLDLPPPPIPPDPLSMDPRVLSNTMFPNLPHEAAAQEAQANPVIERTPTPPPPGLPSVEWPADAVAHSVSLLFDDGQNIPLTDTTAIGRAPEGSEHAPPGCVIAVVSGDQVSRCHLLVRPTASGAEVIDTNSLNGCFVDYLDRPGSGPQIPVGVPVPIEPGQQLRFGDRSLIVVGHP